MSTLAPKYKGEVTITIAGTELDLRFKTRNLVALTELTGKGPAEFAAAYMPEDGQGENAAAIRLANPALLLPIIAAGCAHHPEHAKQSVRGFLDNLEDLIDKEVDESGLSPVLVYTLLAGQVFMPFMFALQGISEVDGEPVGKLVARAQKEAAKLRSGAGESSTSEPLPLESTPSA